MEGSCSLLLLAISIILHSALHREISARQVSILNSKPIHRYFAQEQDYECSIEEYLTVTPYISTECKEGLKSVQNAGLEAIRKACEIPTCITPFLNYMLDQSCYDEPFAEYVVLHCGVNFYSGKPCYSQVQDVGLLDSFFNEACLSALIDPNTCTEECTDALTKISTVFGCCINNLFNNTQTRYDATITTYALSYELWSHCGVETPGLCPVDFNFTQYLTPETLQGYMMSFGIQPDFSFPDFNQAEKIFPELNPEITPPPKLIPDGIVIPEPQPGDTIIPEFQPVGGTPQLPPGQIDVPQINPQNGNTPKVQPPPTLNNNLLQPGGVNNPDLQPWDVEIPDHNAGEINIPPFSKFNTNFPQLQQWNYLNTDRLKSRGGKEPVFKPEGKDFWPKLPQLDVKVPEFNPWYKNKIKLQQWGIKAPDFLSWDSKTPQLLPSDGDFKSGSVKRPEFKPGGINTKPDLKPWNNNIPRLHDALKLQQWDDKFPEFLPREIKVPKSQPWRILVREFLPSNAKVAKNQKNGKIHELNEEDILDLLSRSLDE